EGVVIDDTGLFNTRLKEWEDFYNFHRPHGALGGQTPYERLREKTRPERERTPSAAHVERTGSRERLHDFSPLPITTCPTTTCTLLGTAQAHRTGRPHHVVGQNG